jgi:hypothetical protein
MSMFERRVLAELRILRDSEAALAGMYETLRRSGPAAETFFRASLKNLDERVDRLESFLEGAA